MTKRAFWTVFICSVVLSLVSASCGSAPTTTTQGTSQKTFTPSPTPSSTVAQSAQTTTLALKKADGTMVQKTMEKPQYGGILTECESFSNVSFDPITVSAFNGLSFQITNEGAIEKDWSRGPSGTNENSFRTGLLPPTLDQYKPCLAESWELPDNETVIFHIRKGVHYGLNPNSEASRMVNGREFVAADMMFVMDRTWFKTPGNFTSLSFPYIKSMATPDKYTLVVKTTPNYNGIIWEESSINRKYECPDVINKYGNSNDWHNAVGTGPYILTDYVESSSLTLVKNKNYWGKDPFFPENTLPYPDGVRILIIPDTSTQLAALRTAKIDHLGNSSSMVTWDTALELKKTNPELKYTSNVGTGWGIQGMIDDPTLPYSKLNVRKALNMAVDKQAMIKDYFGGEAVMYYFPFREIPEMKYVTTPWTDAPADVKETYQYNPDKARQLLKDAGYPNGFKTTLTCTQTYADIASVVKDYWSKIGVNLQINLIDNAVYTNMLNRRDGYELVPVGNFEAGDPRTGSAFKARSQFNRIKINDPFFEDIYNKLDASFYNDAARNDMVKQVGLHALQQVYAVTLGANNQYTFWWPWLKGYNGEYSTTYSTWYGWPKFVWIDQKLKADMGR